MLDIPWGSIHPYSIDNSMTVQTVFMKGFKLALQDFITTRLLLYCLVHTVKHYTFVEKIFKNSLSLLTYLNKEDRN